MSDDYDVLPLPTHIGGIINKHSDLIKPFVGVYFPQELLDKMKWSKGDRLTLRVQKDGLKIFKDEADREPFFYDTHELIYEDIEYE